MDSLPEWDESWDQSALLRFLEVLFALSGVPVVVESILKGIPGGGSKFSGITSVQSISMDVVLPHERASGDR